MIETLTTQQLLALVLIVAGGWLLLASITLPPILRRREKGNSDALTMLDKSAARDTMCTGEWASAEDIDPSDIDLHRPYRN